MADDSPRLSVLFVCLGNICRSPMAEAIFKHNVQKYGLQSRFKTIDSAGTGDYHIGSPPDSRSSRTCAKYGIPTNHRARQVSEEDFEKFDYLLAMDESNLEDLEEIADTLKKQDPKAKLGKVQLFGDYRKRSSKFGKIVQDPYYGGAGGFEENFKQLTAFSEEFLRQVVGEDIVDS